MNQEATPRRLEAIKALHRLTLDVHGMGYGDAITTYIFNRDFSGLAAWLVETFGDHNPELNGVCNALWEG